jgi:hypothetical protein
MSKLKVNLRQFYEVKADYRVLRSNKSPKVGLIDLRLMSESSLKNYPYHEITQ